MITKKNSLIVIGVIFLIFSGIFLIKSLNGSNSDSGNNSVKSEKSTNEQKEKSTRGEVIKKEITNGAKLIDVRTDAEYNQVRIADSENFPLSEIQSGNFPNIHKNSKIYVYCRSGNRSAYAKKLLNDAGFSNVEDLGGIMDVRSLGFEMTN